MRSDEYIEALAEIDSKLESSYSGDPVWAIDSCGVFHSECCGMAITMQNTGGTWVGSVDQFLATGFDRDTVLRKITEYAQLKQEKNRLLNLLRQAYPLLEQFSPDPVALDVHHRTLGGLNAFLRRLKKEILTSR